MNSICVRSPGRINFIGEHVDYIETYSCPATINLYNNIIIIKTLSRSIRIYSDKFGDSKEISFEQIYNIKEYDFSDKWYGYFIGILRALFDIGIKIIEGFEVKIVSNLPEGAGLSSSASIEVGFLLGLNYLFLLGLKDIDIVKISKKAENIYMKAPCGIMDQYTIMYGKKNNCLFLDYTNLTHKYCEIPNNIRFFIIDTKIKHSIAAEGYKNRIEEKNKIEKIIKENFNICIKDAVIKAIEDYIFYSRVILKINDAILNKRFNHFVSETQRVLNFYDKINKNDILNAFSFLNQSHVSLSNLYEVSITQIDELMLDIQKIENVLGARMIGGGFGGSCLVVSKKDFDTNLLKEKIEKNNKKYDSKINFFEIEIDDGVHIL